MLRGAYGRVNTKTKYTYNKNGSRKSTVYGDGSREEYRYDAAGNVSEIKHVDYFAVIAPEPSLRDL